MSFVRFISTGILHLFTLSLGIYILFVFIKKISFTKSHLDLSLSFFSIVDYFHNEFYYEFYQRV